MMLDLNPIGVFQDRTVPEGTRLGAGLHLSRRSRFLRRSGGRVASLSSMFEVATGETGRGPSLINATGQVKTSPTT
jgi:hypothetical protein